MDTGDIKQLSIPGYRELVEQRRALDEQIERLRKEAVDKAIETIKSLIAEYDIRATDIFPHAHIHINRRARNAGADHRGRVAPKYRNPATGETWSGRGKAPLWIAGKDREQFLIRDTQQSIV